MKVLKSAWLLLFCVLPVVSLTQEGYITEYEVQYEVEFSMLKNDLDFKQTEVLYLYTSPQASLFVNETFDSDQANNWVSFFSLIVYININNGKVIAIEDLSNKNYAYQQLNLQLFWRMLEYSIDISQNQVEIHAK